MIEEITNNGRVIAIIIGAGSGAVNLSGEKPWEDGIHFFTPDDFSQQLGLIKRPAGAVIQPHRHLFQPRGINYTQEVLIIKKGKLRVDFYAEDTTYLQSRILNAGEAILLAAGGHGFEILEDLEMFEVKQGPYIGIEDKARFQGVAKDNLKLERSADG